MRAKYKIKTARIPYRVLDDAGSPDRLRAVLSVLYLRSVSGPSSAISARSGKPGTARHQAGAHRWIHARPVDEPAAVELHGTGGGGHRRGAEPERARAFQMDAPSALQKIVAAML